VLGECISREGRIRPYARYMYREQSVLSPEDDGAFAGGAETSDVVLPLTDAIRTSDTVSSCELDMRSKSRRAR
jgi:hypothetical protein